MTLLIGLFHLRNPSVSSLLFLLNDITTQRITTVTERTRPLQRDRITRVSHAFRCARSVGCFEWPFGFDRRVDHQRFRETIVILCSHAKLVVLPVLEPFDVAGGTRDRRTDFRPFIRSILAPFDHVMLDFISTVILLQDRKPPGKYQSAKDDLPMVSN